MGRLTDKVFTAGVEQTVMLPIVTKWSIVVVFGAACVTKVFAFASQPQAAPALALTCGVAALEGTTALSWLRFGVTKGNCAVAIAQLVIFACVSGFHAATGKLSCGCFGTVSVDPSIMFSIDVVLVSMVGAVIARATEDPWALMLRRFATVWSTTWLAMCAVSVAMQQHVVYLSHDSPVSERNEHVVLEPTRWTGLPCPLLGHIVNGDAFRIGTWQVTLVHNQACSPSLAA